MTRLKVRIPTSGPRPDWDLLFALPNLNIEDRDLDSVGLTLGMTGGPVIVRSDDERVTSIRSWSAAADAFLRSFHDGNQRPITFGVLIAPEGLVQRLGRNADPIVGFRNAVALSAVLPTRTRAGGSWMGPSWSDAFDFHPAQLLPDGTRLDFVTPSLNSIGFELTDLSLTPDLGVPRAGFGGVDEYIAVRLGRLWRTLYLRRRDILKASRAFRSLEIAYQASAVSFKNYASLNEVGLSCVLWVSAMEVLASPPGRNVTRWDGMDLVGEYPWSEEPRLRHRRYRVGGQSNRRSVNLAQKVYHHLYTARSKFVHGDEVSDGLLFPFGRDAPPLVSLASTVYRTALRAYLDRHWPWEPTTTDLRSLDLFVYGGYHEHLLNAIADNGDW